MTAKLADLPEGTVTVLFTDVVASTELTNRVGDQKARDLMRVCEDLVRRHVTEHGGREVKGTGDGLMIAFTSARRAVEAAVAIQCVLAETADERLPMRIGLNTGEVVRDDADLFGATVIAASRIANEASANEILISEATKIMLGPATTFEVVERSKVDLKGFDEPWTLYAVEWGTVPVPEAEPDTVPPPTSLPAPRGDVIGREDDIAAVVDALGTPNRRLVTLVGPGGVGKTTLSLEAGRRFAAEHARAVTFVRLDAVASADRIPVAIARAIGIRLAGQGDAREQLLQRLQDHDRLLILDNFEHLIEGAGLVGDILDTAGELRVLVSSRQALGVRGEWRYMVTGLRVPGETHIEDPETYAAVRLFAERAQQARSDFSLARERDDVVRITRLVEGVPLALELAASWAATLPTSEIASEIERGIDLLESSFIDIPDRHRSMRAVFEQSWSRLSEDEQRVFARLSVFRGGFDRNAAREVAGASLPLLASFVDRSLVRLEPDGRYRLHEVLRQAADEKLSESPDDVEATLRAHCDFYLGYLEEQRKQMVTGQQVEAGDALATEFDNVLLAWRRALEQNAEEKLRLAVPPLTQFYQFRGRYAEAYSVFVEAAEQMRLREHTPEGLAAFVLILVEVAWFAIRLGRIREAAEALRESLELIDQGAPYNYGFAADPYTALGVVAMIEGDYEQAASRAREALDLADKHNDDYTRQLGYYVLTTATGAAGRLEEAREYGLRAYDLARRLNDHWFMAYCLNELGSVSASLGEYEQAREYQNASYGLRKEFGDPEGMAVALNRLGDIAAMEGDHQQAGDNYRRAVAIYREIKDQGGLADSLRGLGECALNIGSMAQAARYFREALEITNDIGHVPMTLSTLTGASELLIASGKIALGSSVLGAVRAHASVDEATSARAARVLKESGARAAKDIDLQDALLKVDAELLTLESHAQPSRADNVYVEPLTDREREVLERIAAGRSNSEIAEELVVSIGTVKAHTGNIYNKLGVHNRVQAVARAREAGLIAAD